MESYSTLKEEIQILMLESQFNTVEEKVSVLFQIFEKCLPYSDASAVLNVILKSAQILGLRSSKEVFTKEYLDFIYKQNLPNPRS